MDEDAPEHILECPQNSDPQAECKCEVNGVYARCIVCRVSFAKSDIFGMRECPECRTILTPMHPNGDTTVKVHWLELQTLACWAEQLAAHYGDVSPDMKKAVYAITHELEVQHPMNSPLTVGRELGLLREKTPTIESYGKIDAIAPKIRLQ